MAYAATVTWKMQTISGQRRLYLKVVETEAGAATEWGTVAGITGVTVQDDGGREVPVPMFRSGVIRDVRAYKSAGAAATIDPELGRTAAWSTSTLDHIWANGTAGALVQDKTVGFAVFGAPDDATPALYGRSKCASGSDNTVTTEITIDEVA